MTSIELTQAWYQDYFCAYEKGSVEALLEQTKGETPAQGDVEDFFAEWITSRGESGMWEEWELGLLDEQFPQIDWALMYEYVLDSVCAYGQEILDDQDAA